MNHNNRSLNIPLCIYKNCETTLDVTALERKGGVISHDQIKVYFNIRLKISMIQSNGEK